MTEYITKTGKVLTDSDIEALANEAEQGYDVSHLKRRPSRNDRQFTEDHATIETCSHPGCTASFRHTGQWTAKRAQKAGWFFQRNGDRWCPDHHPAWVEEWRRKQREAKEGGQ